MHQVELGDVAEFINGAAFKPEDWGENGQRIIRIQNLNDPTKPFNRTNRQVPEKYHVHTGTLLVSWSASLGVFEWNEPDTALLNQHIFKVLPDTRIVRQDYLRLMLSKALIDMEKHAHGSTMLHVNRGEFLGTKIPLPPLEEQKRIAAILDQADDIRRKRQHAIERLNQLGQAVFHEMFGDPATLPRSHSFAEVAAIQQSLVDPKLPQYRGELHLGPEHIVSGSGNVEWHRVRTAEQDNVISGKNRFNEHDILYSKIRPYLNKVALSDRSGICSADMYVIRPEPKKSVAQFLKMLLMGSDFLSYAETCSNRANIPKINRKQLEAYKFYCPSMELQQEFQRRLTDLEVLKKPFFSANEGGQQLFESLQHRAFTGQL
jgi:type I restriction enzyme S subunit